MIESKSYITQAKIDDCATVRVLKIMPDVVVKCDRNCSCLEESKDGSIQCCIGRIKKMSNFQITALVIDFEIIMDRKADWDWSVCPGYMPVIDDSGGVHEGEFICDSFVTPERISNNPDTLYPGTKGKFRIFYETFPKDGKVSSIMVDVPGCLHGRIDLLSNEPQEFDFEEERKPISVPLQQQVEQPKDDELRERVETLEFEMRKLRAELDRLQRTLANNDSLPRDPFAPMRDPGISYHPLEKK